MAEISEVEMTALNKLGYSEADLSMLAKTEIEALLHVDTDEVLDPHGAAEAEQDAAVADAPAAEAAADEAKADDTPTEVPGGFAQLQTEVPADIQEQIKVLRDEAKASFKQLMEGTGDAEAYEEVKDRTDQAIEELRIKALTANIYADVNRQNAEQQVKNEWERAQRESFASFKAQGLDYKDPARPALLAAFNHHLKALAAVPANEKRDGKWFLDEAHKLTKSDLGFIAPQKSVPGTPRGVDPRELPPTLRSAPAAATNAVNSDEFAHMRGLDGIALERAYAGLTEAAAERWRSE